MSFFRMNQAGKYFNIFQPTILFNAMQKRGIESPYTIKELSKKTELHFDPVTQPNPTQLYLTYPNFS